jgi:Mn-dependent DtxR family transcriptional regulator
MDHVEEGAALARMSDDQRALMVEIGNVVCAEGGPTLATISERMQWTESRTECVLSELEALGLVTSIPPTPARGVKVHHFGDDSTITPLTSDQQALADLVLKVTLGGHTPRVLELAKELHWSPVRTAETLAELERIGIVTRHQLSHA